MTSAVTKDVEHLAQPVGPPHDPATTLPAPESRVLPRWPSYGAEEIEAVAEVLRSGRVNSWTGADVARFEREFSALFERRRTIALANGTVSLEIALEALDVGPGDDVVVAARSFVASASCIVRRGATPVFADVDRDSQNVTAESLERAITARTRAVIVVHLAGRPCEMDDIVALLEARRLHLIEDCAQAHGARYRGRPVGGFGAFGSWSFCQDKIISTGGEGGALTTDVEEHWARAWSLKEHGKSVSVARSAAGASSPGPDYRWIHESFGGNARMTGMQAAIGSVQLRQLGRWTERRNRNAARLWDCCRSVAGLRCPAVPDHLVHAAYLAYAFVEPDRLREGWDRRRILAELLSRGVPAGVGSCPELYREPAFAASGLAPTGPLPVARELGETSLAFAVHPRLTDEHVDWMIDSIRHVMARAARSAAP